MSICPTKGASTLVYFADIWGMPECFSLNTVWMQHSVWPIDIKVLSGAVPRHSLCPVTNTSVLHFIVTTLLILECFHVSLIWSLQPVR